MSDQIKIDTQIRINAYKIISDTVDRAVEYGWARSHKHTDHPTHDHIKNEICLAIMNDLCEILKFDEE